MKLKWVNFVVLVSALCIETVQNINISNIRLHFGVICMQITQLHLTPNQEDSFSSRDIYSILYIMCALRMNKL